MVSPVLQGDGDAGVVLLGAGEPHAGLEVDLAPAEGALERLGAGLVLVRRPAGAAPRRSSPRRRSCLQTQANSTPMTPPPSTTTRLGHVVEGEGLVAGHDPAADLEAGQRARVRAGGEHDVAALQPAAADLDGVGGDEPAVALDDLDLAGLHQTLQALVEPADDAVLVLVDARSCRCPRAWCARRTARSRGSWSATSAACSRAFVGMQPRCRHVPPTLSRSTMATDRFSSAARRAAAYPPLPRAEDDDVVHLLAVATGRTRSLPESSLPRYHVAADGLPPLAAHCRRHPVTSPATISCWGRRPSGRSRSGRGTHGAAHSSQSCTTVNARSGSEGHETVRGGAGESLGLFGRRRGGAGGAQAGAGRRPRHLEDFVRTRVGVEAFVEPRDDGDPADRAARRVRRRVDAAPGPRPEDRAAASPSDSPSRSTTCGWSATPGACAPGTSATAPPRDALSRPAGLQASEPARAGACPCARAVRSSHHARAGAVPLGVPVEQRPRRAPAARAARRRAARSSIGRLGATTSPSSRAERAEAAGQLQPRQGAGERQLRGQADAGLERGRHDDGQAP